MLERHAPGGMMGGALASQSALNQLAVHDALVGVYPGLGGEWCLGRGRCMVLAFLLARLTVERSQAWQAHLHGCGCTQHSLKRPTKTGRFPVAAVRLHFQICKIFGEQPEQDTHQAQKPSLISASLARG